MQFATLLLLNSLTIIQSLRVTITDKFDDGKSDDEKFDDNEFVFDSKDEVLTDNQVQEMMLLDPDWDEPFALVKDDSELPFGHAESLNLEKRMNASIYQYYYREAMHQKVPKQTKKDKRVKLMGPKDFNIYVAQGRLFDLLPAEGAILFIVDHPTASNCASPRAPKEILDDPRILAIGAENWMGPKHHKVTNLPIGFESKVMGAAKGKDVLLALLQLIEHPIPLDQRIYNVQSDAHLHDFGHPASGYRDDRGDMVRDVERSAIDDWYTKHVALLSHITNHVAYSRLSLCPEGNGMDTHRFYHNYALRTRCIVRKGWLSDLHGQFPGTIVVDSWKEVTQENINRWIKETYTYDPEMITSDYWIKRVMNVAAV